MSSSLSLLLSAFAWVVWSSLIPTLFNQSSLTQRRVLLGWLLLFLRDEKSIKGGSGHAESRERPTRPILLKLLTFDQNVRIEDGVGFSFKRTTRF